MGPRGWGRGLEKEEGVEEAAARGPLGRPPKGGCVMWGLEAHAHWAPTHRVQNGLEVLHHALHRAHHGAAQQAPHQRQPAHEARHACAGPAPSLVAGLPAACVRVHAAP